MNEASSEIPLMKNTQHPNEVKAQMKRGAPEPVARDVVAQALRHERRDRDDLKKKEKMETLEKTALRDSLTGLYNRTAFEGNSRVSPPIKSMFQEAYSHALRTVEPLSLFFFDLDHLKEINDLHGHKVGDDVLKQLSEILIGEDNHKGKLRDEDLAFRWGGDEFAVLLPNTTSERAFILAERIRQIIEFSQTIKENMRVTISGGLIEITQSNDPDCTPKSFIKEADMLLYKAKEAGRNRIIIQENKKEDEISPRTKPITYWTEKRRKNRLDQQGEEKPPTQEQIRRTLEETNKGALQGRIKKE